MQQRVVVLVLAAAAVLQTVLVALQLPGWPCAFRIVTGVPCPGCGLSRALAALWSGDWRAAVAFHAFAPLAAACGMLLLAALLLREDTRARVAERVTCVESRTGLSVFLAASFLVYWVVRLLYYPLTLAPPG